MTLKKIGIITMLLVCFVVVGFMLFQYFHQSKQVYDGILVKQNYTYVC